MANFICRIKDEAGKVYSTVSEADDAKTLRKSLRDHGFYVLEVRPFRERRNLLLVRRKISLDNLITFTHQLASMLDTGIPILRALDILWKQNEDPNFQIIISQLKNKLSQGVSLFDAFNAFPWVFPPMYRALLGVAEIGASLVKILRKLLEYLNTQREFILKLKKAIAYPIIVVGVAILAVIVMLLWVIPTFQTVFAKIKIELPLFTRIVIAISSIMRTFYFWLFAALISISLFVFYKKFASTQKGRDLIDRLKLRIPFFGKLFYAATIARLVRSLSLLIGGGLPIAKSIEISSQTALNTKVSKALDLVRERITEGVSLGKALAETRVFPPLLEEMVYVGEESGILVEMLDKVAVHFEEEFDFRFNRFLTVIEPVMIVCVGVLVVFILLSIYLPIFKLWGALSGLR